MKGKIWFVMLCGLLMISKSTAVQAQDIHFSQFYETSILRNPALTGVFQGDYKVGAFYRSQWSSIANPYQTAMVTAEMRFGVGKSVTDFLSFGLLSYYDRAGSLNMQTLALYPSVNYSKALNAEHHRYLSVGFTGGYLQRSYDPGAATFNNQYQSGQYDPSNPSGENLPNPKISNYDLGAGISYSSTTGNEEHITYYVGASGYHFTEPKQSFYNNNLIKLQMKWNGNAGMTMKMSENSGLQLHANYMVQGTYQEIMLGGLLSWNKRTSINDEGRFAVYGGIFYRVNDALIPTVKIEFGNYAISGSYDVNVSSLSAASSMRGGYEMSFFITGLFHAYEGTSKQTICPKF
ncbi:MAG: PorP/SprF family type IX secretion system membrane protein [Bacteroidota bacterium]